MVVLWPCVRFRPEPATHQRAQACEARSFEANEISAGLEA